MYNQQHTLAKIEHDPTGKLIATIHMHVPGSTKVHLRRVECMTLVQFRDRFVRHDGLWAHYFHCTKCGWERRRIATCKYCDIPMAEIGAPGTKVGIRKGAAILKINPDLIPNEKLTFLEYRDNVPIFKYTEKPVKKKDGGLNG